MEMTLEQALENAHNRYEALLMLAQLAGIEVIEIELVTVNADDLMGLPTFA